jgi:hypothetical protein
MESENDQKPRDGWKVKQQGLCKVLGILACPPPAASGEVQISHSGLQVPKEHVTTLA